MMLVRAYLAASSIEGLGVFSRDDIRKGDLVWKFDPRFDQLIDRKLLDEVDDRVLDFLYRYGYEMADKPGFIALDADECRFLNHADEPNLDFTVSGLATALEDIPAGTELTCNYRDFMVSDVWFMQSRHGVGATNEHDRQMNQAAG